VDLLAPRKAEATSFFQGGELLEVLWAEETGNDEALDSGRGLVEVEGAVRHSAWDIELLRGSQVAMLAVEYPVGDAVEAHDGFVVVAMEVREKGARVRREDEFVEIEGSLGLVAAFDKGDTEVADLDRFVHGARFGDGSPHEIKLFYKTNDVCKSLQ
jgi:hypothetical protein